MSYVEHVLIAETGTSDASRYAIMAGVRIDDPAVVVERLAAGADHAAVLAVLRETAFEIRIAFASKQRLETIGADWRYAFLPEVSANGFDPNRNRARREGFSLVAHLPDNAPFDFDWLAAYLTETVWSARVQTRILPHDAPLLALPALVAHLFHEAIETERGRASPARERYDAIAPLVTRVEDVGLDITYSSGGTVADAILRSSHPS